MPGQPRLSELEQDVMKILWSRPACSVADVQNVLASKRPLKDSTIRTILTRLEAKGYVEHKLEGRSFLYSGIERPASVAARAVKQIVDRFCHGSLESLLVGMVDNELADPDELRRISARLSSEHKTRVPPEAKPVRKT